MNKPKLTAGQKRRNQIIRSWLEFSGVSMAELGRRVSGSGNAVKDILSGKVAAPTERTILAIARQIGLDASVLEDTNRPMPEYGFGPDACGHALVRIPENVIARNEQQEMDFVAFPGAGIERRLDQVEHLSMAGAGALRVWRVWHELDPESNAHTCDWFIVDISACSTERSDDLYVAIESKSEVVIRKPQDFVGDERVIGRICQRL